MTLLGILGDFSQLLQLDLQTFCMFPGVNLPRAGFAGLLDEVSLVHSGDAESALLLYLKRVGHFA